MGIIIAFRASVLTEVPELILSSFGCFSHSEFCELSVIMCLAMGIYAHAVYFLQLNWEAECGAENLFGKHYV